MESLSEYWEGVKKNGCGHVRNQYKIVFFLKRKNAERSDKKKIVL